MKIEKINNFDYNIYVYSLAKDNINIIEEVRDLINKLQKRLRLQGFYKVIVCEKIRSLFIQVILLDKSYYVDTLDLKIDVSSNEDVYYKTRDYFLIDCCSKKYYYQNYYYGLVDESFDNILEKVEFGDFVFGKQLDVFWQYKEVV